MEIAGVLNAPLRQRYVENARSASLALKLWPFFLLLLLFLLLCANAACLRTDTTNLTLLSRRLQAVFLSSLFHLVIKHPAVFYKL